MRFTNAIVRKPGRNLAGGLTEAGLGFPDYLTALRQHSCYTEALRGCGLEVRELEADEDYPDSTFVEDTSLLTPHCAIITNPGAPSRRGETVSMRGVLGECFDRLEEIKIPGTVDAGDIMMVGDHYYIGLSGRTNQPGAEQVMEILGAHGLSGSTVPLRDMLHLKTGVSYLENNNLLVSGEFIGRPEFKEFRIMKVPPEEAYAANSLWINGRVLVPAGFPVTTRRVREAGYEVIEVEISEFRKLDGGLSCLSLRW